MISTINPNKKIKNKLNRNLFLIELLITNKNRVSVKTYGEDERKKSFSSDSIPKNPLMFINHTIKIEKFFSSFSSSIFNILVY